MELASDEESPDNTDLETSTDTLLYRSHAKDDLALTENLNKREPVTDCYMAQHGICYSGTLLQMTPRAHPVNNSTLKLLE